MARISSSSSSTQTPDSFSSGSPTQVSVALTTTLLLAANPNRKYAYISNNTGSTIYIQYQASATFGVGIKLPPNTLYTIETNNLWLGSVNAVSNTGSTLIDVFEGE